MFDIHSHVLPFIDDGSTSIESSIALIKEEMAKPLITKEHILAFLERLRKLNTNKLEHRRRLIDTFINKVVLYDDGRIFIGCNYTDCSKEITFDKFIFV